MPASSKSFMVMVPVGFSRVTNAACTSAGHSTCHKNGVIAEVPLHHTPPAPSLHASVYCMRAGGCVTRRNMEVGCIAIYCTNTRQSARVCLRRGVMVTMSVACCKAMSRGVKRLLPPGMPKDACCNFPVNCWNFLMEMRGLRKMRRRRLHIWSHFSFGSWMV